MYGGAVHPLDLLCKVVKLRAEEAGIPHYATFHFGEKRASKRLQFNKEIWCQIEEDMNNLIEGFTIRPNYGIMVSSLNHRMRNRKNK